MNPFRTAEPVAPDPPKTDEEIEAELAAALRKATEILAYAQERIGRDEELQTILYVLDVIVAQNSLMAHRLLMVSKRLEGKIDDLIDRQRRVHPLDRDKTRE